MEHAEPVKDPERQRAEKRLLEKAVEARGFRNALVNKFGGMSQKGESQEKKANFANLIADLEDKLELAARLAIDDTKSTKEINDFTQDLVLMVAKLSAQEDIYGWTQPKGTGQVVPFRRKRSA